MRTEHFAASAQSRGLSRAKGFSLVELMVGVAVGLIGVLAIMQAFQVNEGYKRSTTGTGLAQANGAIALFSIEREARMAGYGFINSEALGCNTISWYYDGQYSSPPGAPGPSALPPITLAPILITPGVAGAPDAITVTYGNDDKRLIPTTTLTHPAASAEIKVNDNYGFNESDLFIIAQGGSCQMYNATKLNTADVDRLQRNPGLAGKFNPPGNGLYGDYGTGATVLNLGQLSVNRYDISNNDLRVTQLFSFSGVNTLPTLSNQTQVLVNDIVDLKAYYGKDTNGDGNIDIWDKVQPTTAAGWLQVTALRISMLARSGNYEKPSRAGDPCTATQAAPTFVKDPSKDPTVAAAVGSAASRYEYFTIPGGLPSCYKFRAFETVVPLHNLIWKAS